MKKVMFAAAVAASMVAFGAGEIASQNVVGYAQTGTVDGNKIIGAQFANVGTAKAIDLTDIKVTGYEESTEAQVTVQSLDSAGRGGETFFFYDVPGQYYGWYDGDDEPVEKGAVILQPGEGFWTSAPNANFGLQTAGEVSTADIAVTLRDGNTMVVNSTPVAVDLTKVGVTGYTGSTEAQVTVQSLDSAGRGGETFFFYDVPGQYFGWYDGDDEPVEEGAVMIQPGEGLWVSAPSAAFGIVLPGVEL